jgi:hypothetical protein
MHNLGYYLVSVHMRVSAKPHAQHKERAHPGDKRKRARPALRALEDSNQLVHWPTGWSAPACKCLHAQGQRH